MRCFGNTAPTIAGTQRALLCQEAESVVACREPVDSVFVVYKLGSFEPYAWHAAYQDCLKRDRFRD